MQCEICGQEGGKLVTISLDRSQLDVCNDCKHYGKIIDEKNFSRPSAQKTHNLSGMGQGQEIAPGYGKKIMQGRQRKGYTFEELGKKIFEKESHLHRIESEAVKPSPKLAKKLEKELEINLAGEQNE